MIYVLLGGALSVICSLLLNLLIANVLNYTEQKYGWTRLKNIHDNKIIKYASLFIGILLPYFAYKNFNAFEPPKTMPLKEPSTIAPPTFSPVDNVDSLSVSSGSPPPSVSQASKGPPSVGSAMSLSNSIDSMI